MLIANFFFAWKVFPGLRSKIVIYHSQSVGNHLTRWLPSAPCPTVSTLS